MTSVVTFAKEELIIVKSSELYKCRALYLINVHQEGEDSFLVESYAKGDTCAEAMAMAKLRAHQKIAYLTAD